jgi:hypothetical protein
MNYPDGTTVRIGDSVFLNHGDVPGVVFDVIETAERRGNWNVDESGLMIESPVYGLVFLRLSSLVDDEVALVSRQMA